MNGLESPGRGEDVKYEFALTRSLAVSFQRYSYPAAGVVTGLAPSGGALPFLLGASQHLVLPCPDGEAFWIGLVTSPGSRHRLRMVVSTASGDRVDALTGAEPADSEGFLAPPPHGVAGIRRPDGSWWAFAREAGDASAPVCRSIELRCQSAETPARPVAGPQRQHIGPGQPPVPSEPGAAQPFAAAETASVWVDVIAPEQFRALGGVGPPPLNEADRYGGWRLP